MHTSWGWGWYENNFKQGIFGHCDDFILKTNCREGGAYFAFGLEGMLAAVEGLELVARLEVGPPVQLAVDHVREPLVVRHLKPPVGRPRDRHALGIRAL